ncbi:MAG: glycosyltransferase family 8 protein [Bacteroidales bacterium]|nr:glycosyltransferase family 8 protein [Bacteroidales bacterium]
MNTIPVILTFDENMSLPAAVCISSIMQAGKADDFYDFFVLHAGNQPVITSLEKIIRAYPNMRVQYRSVGNEFSGAFEIRGITAAAYYRLLAPELVLEYDKAIYADVDMIIRLDMSELYRMEMGENYLGAVYGLGLNTTKEGRDYVKSIGLVPGDYFLSGFLLMDLEKMRKDGIVSRFKALAGEKFKYQDQDIMNLVCNGRIMSIPYVYSMVVGAYESVIMKTDILHTKYLLPKDDKDPLIYSNIHYNGMKPWKGWCPNLDQWWEFYRKSPIYDSKVYFSYFYNKLEEYDQLPLLKRLKILFRYFTVGKKKPKYEF